MKKRRPEPPFNKSKSDRFEKPASPKRADRAPRSEKPTDFQQPKREEDAGRAPRSDRFDRTPREERSSNRRGEDKFEKRGPASKQDRPYRKPASDRPDRNERNERPDRNERSERPARSERPERSPRAERPNKYNDRDKKSDRPKREARSGAPEYDVSRIRSFDKKRNPSFNEEIRLNKYISNSGVCSRREADELIKNGDVAVNGTVVTEMGYKVKPTDKITYKKKLLKRERLVYLLLNKPKDYITTLDDPDQRKTVMDLVGNACEERLYPVGRLDRKTTGLLLFTNDGELAKRLTHPSFKVKKVYEVGLNKPMTQDHFDQIADGLTLDDGPVKIDDLVVLSSDNMNLGVEIHVGKNRIVRRIFEHLGYDVIKLDRVLYGGLTKKDLPRGKWRFLKEKEVINLKHF